MSALEMSQVQLLNAQRESTFERLLTRATQVAVVVLLAGMILSIWGAVVTRYIMQNPIPWGEQVAKYFMVWAALLGASLGLREGSHISVGLFVKYLPDFLKKVCAALVFVIFAVFLIVGTVYGAMFAYNVRSHLDPVVNDMSLAYAYSAIPVGCLLMLVQLYFVFRKGTAVTNSEASLS